jgi:hypothetical protein
MITPSEFGTWAIEQHNATNHYYDGKPGSPTALPYSYHLSMAASVAKQFDKLIDIGFQYLWVIDAVWAHDTIEDARCSYNDVYKAAIRYGHNHEHATCIAEAVRAVTNYGRGRNRDERMPDYIYDEIRNTEGATFVKLCDRIANVKHGLITGSSMKKKYLKEQPHFKIKLYTEDLKPMWDYLDRLLVTEI